MSKIKLLTIILGVLAVSFISTLTTPAVQADEPSTYTVYLPLVVKAVASPRWQIAAGPSDGIWSNLTIRVSKPAGDLEVVIKNDRRTGNAGFGANYMTQGAVCYWLPQEWCHECHWFIQDTRSRELQANLKYTGEGPVSVKLFWNGKLYDEKEVWLPGNDPKPDPLPPVPLACEIHPDVSTLTPGQTWIELVCTWWSGDPVYEVDLEIGRRDPLDSAWVGAEPQATVITADVIQWMDPPRGATFRGRLQIAETDVGHSIWIGAVVDYPAGLKSLGTRTYQVVQ